MTAALTALLAVLTKIAGSATTELITEIITALTALIPILIQEYQAVVPQVQNIINVLRGNTAITQEQNDALDELENTYDADFEAAVAAYGAAPPAA